MDFFTKYWMEAFLTREPILYLISIRFLSEVTYPNEWIQWTVNTEIGSLLYLLDNRQLLEIIKLD